MGGGLGVEEVLQAVVHLRRADRLGQHGDGADGSGDFVVMVGTAGEQDELDRADGRIGDDLAGERDSVETRHLLIDDGHGIGLVMFGGVAQPGHSGAAVRDGRRVHPPGAGVLTEKLQAVGIVVDDEQSLRGQAVGGWPRLLGPGGLQGERNGEVELAPLAGLAGYLEMAAHELDELAADGQSEPGTAGLAVGRGVDPGKGLEEERQVVSRNADASVDDGDGDLRPAVGRGGRGDGADEHFTALGELHGVAEQVEQGLAQPTLVAAHRGGEVGRVVADNFEVLVAGRLGGHLDHRFEELVQVEVGLGEADLPGLDLGEVEDVVDDREQGPAGAADRLGVPQLCWLQRGLQQQVDQPDDAIHGGADLVADRGDEL